MNVFTKLDPVAHYYGQTVDHKMTAGEVLRAAGLSGWDVQLSTPSITTLDDNGVTTHELKKMRVTTRLNSEGNRVPLGDLKTVSPTYRIHQNEETVDFLDALVEESGAHFTAGGTLRGGKEMFVQMQLPRTVKVGGVDDVELNLLVLNSHDGSSAFRALLTPTRLACSNQMRVALKDARYEHRVRHTRNLSSNVAQARAALELQFTYLDSFEVEVERMINTTLTEGRFMDIVTQEFAPKGDSKAAETRSDNLIDDLNALYYSDLNKGIVGTAWGGYNSLTEYYNHHAPVRKAQGREALQRTEKMLSGGYDAQLQRAWELFTPQFAAA